MENLKNFGKCFKNFLIYVVLVVFLSYIFEVLFTTTNSLLQNFIKLLTPLIVTIVLIIRNKELFIDKGKDLKANFIKYFKLIIIYSLIASLILILTNYIINYFTKRISETELINRKVLKNTPIYALTNMIILTPIMEEIVFRGSFKKTLTNKYLFCIFTSLFFGLLHVIFSSDIIYIIPYTSFGLFLSFLYYKTDNIYTNIIMHSLNNIVSIAMLIIGGIL